MKAKPFSIVICSHDRSHDLAECLASLPHAQIDAYGGEIILLDDASNEDLIAMVQATYPAIITRRLGRKSGPSVARNEGARIAQGELLLFLDSDTVVQEMWLEEMLNAGQNADVLAGKIVDYSSGIEQGGARRFTFIGKSVRCNANDANVATGASMGIRRMAFLQLGGFNEELVYYFEERDLCIRAHYAGWRFAYVGRAVVRHKGTAQPTNGAILLQERHSTYAMLIFYRKSIWRVIVFSIFNGIWLLWRTLMWPCKGRIQDTCLLWRGWVQAYRRFWFGVRFPVSW